MGDFYIANRNNHNNPNKRKELAAAAFNHCNRSAVGARVRLKPRVASMRIS